MSPRILQDRVELLDATITAVERYAEVTAAITDAPDRAAARAAVATLLDISDAATRAVLDLPWEDLNVTSQSSRHTERDDLAAELHTRTTSADNPNPPGLTEHATPGSPITGQGQVFR